MKFTTNDYVNILEEIRKTDHEFVNFLSPAETGKYVILRHDIDFSLPDALRMARIENKMGVSSTYFTLLTAPYYNPLSDEGVDILKEIISLGHIVGLHYDASGFENLNNEQQQARVTLLAKTLGSHIGTEVRCIAQHKPASTNIRPTFPNFIDAYEPRFFSDIPYVSDSRRMFRIDDVFSFIKATDRFQILIHPLWWKDKPSHRDAIFSDVHKQISEQAKDLLASEHASIKQFLKTYKS